jgi:hypothetical protein
VKLVLRALRRMWDRPGEQMHDLGYRRAWRDDLEVSIDRSMFEVALYTHPTPIGWLLFQVRFHRAAWRLPSQEHTYYDGCHCSYYLGPIQIHRSTGRWCKRCTGDE